MSSTEIDQYLDELEEPHRSTLAEVRRLVLTVVPDAEEGMSYGAPAFRVDGTAVAGFAAFAKHLSYLPHSGTVLAAVGPAVDGYRTSKGALRFEVDTPLPVELVRTLIEARLVEAGLA